MPDLSTAIMPVLESPRLTALPLGPGQMPPHYAGYGLLNIPATICQLLGAPPIRDHPPLEAALTEPLGHAERVVVVLVDGLRWDLLRQALEANLLPGWVRLAEQGVLAPLTSIAPSTTAAALSTLWTGASPTEHGITGYEVWLKAYGLVANMIFHQPSSFRRGMDALRNTGFEPDKFIPLPTLGEHLARHGIKSIAFQHYTISHSGLSEMLFRETEVRAFTTPAQLWFNVRQALAEAPGEKRFLGVYWGAVDGLEHHHGPHDPRVLAEVHAFGWAMERYFLNALTPAERAGTVLLITADHGHIHTDDDPHFYLKNHPRLQETFHIPPCGENRLMYLYPRPGHAAAMQDYFAEAWPGQFRLVPAEKAIAAGLFGPGEPHPDLHNRVGDWVGLAQGNAYLWWADKKNHLIGRHGGLSREEMLIPFLAARLD